MMLDSLAIGNELSAQTKCKSTPQGQAIDWSPIAKLEWSHFKSAKKKGEGFAIAASTCGYGYDGIQQGDEIEVSIYVRFYCRESWHNDKYEIEDVLKHEQLHFDICELYGRKLYKGVLDLRRKNNLTQDALEALYYKLTEEYEQTQDVYDAETNHSTNGNKQREWNVAISKAIIELAAYAEYKEF